MFRPQWHLSTRASRPPPAAHPGKRVVTQNSTREYTSSLWSPDAQRAAWMAQVKGTLCPALLMWPEQEDGSYTLDTQAAVSVYFPGAFSKETFNIPAFSPLATGSSKRSPLCVPWPRSRVSRDPEEGSQQQEAAWGAQKADRSWGFRQGRGSHAPPPVTHIQSTPLLSTALLRTSSGSRWLRSPGALPAQLWSQGAWGGCGRLLSPKKGVLPWAATETQGTRWVAKQNWDFGKPRGNPGTQCAEWPHPCRGSERCPVTGLGVPCSQDLHRPVNSPIPQKAWPRVDAQTANK